MNTATTRHAAALFALVLMYLVLALLTVQLGRYILESAVPKPLLLG